MVNLGPGLSAEYHPAIAGFSPLTVVNSALAIQLEPGC